jgi:hypothetical protein
MPGWWGMSEGQKKNQQIDPKEVVFKMVKELSLVELRVLLYIFREVSVGEIIAFRELKLKHGIEYDDIVKALETLIKKGYVEYIPGICFNIAKELRTRAVREQIAKTIETVLKLEKSYFSILSSSPSLTYLSFSKQISSCVIPTAKHPTTLFHNVSS